MINPNSSYSINSLDIVKEFIQSIAIVDDKAAYSNDPTATSDFFDAGRIIKSFSEEGVVCSIYKFTEEDDVFRIAKVSKRSDIIILDWKMNPTQASVAHVEDDDEDDDEEDDEKVSKGYYSLKILEEVIPSIYNKFKLFIIYTDEIDFIRIADEIKAKLVSKGLKVSDDSKYSFLCNSSKITIFGKEALKERTSHLEEIANRSFSYSELPNAIYQEFFTFTHGVVSNIFLKSITSVRANTFCLLDTFNRTVDPAFISHKGVLPLPDDAHDQIIELIGSEIKSVISGALSENDTNNQVDSFIELLNEDHLLFTIDKTGLPNVDNIPSRFNIGAFKNLVHKGVISVCKYDKETAKSKIELSKKAIQNLPTMIIKANNPGISNQDVLNFAKNSNLKFAKLTTLRNRYLNTNKPILALGVIVKGKTISNAEEYWLCIQPKCDSVRIAENENQYLGRAFIFLNLTKTSSKGEIILNSGMFNVKYSISQVRQFTFRPTKNGMVQVRGEEIAKWYFIDTFGMRFDYLGELKNDFAQGIANNFASQMSRVATNHSEWLRLNIAK